MIADSFPDGAGPLLPPACAAFRRDLLAAGGSAAGGAHQVDRHPEECAACRTFADGEEVARVRRLARLLASLGPAETALSGDFEEVFARIEMPATPVAPLLSLVETPAPAELDIRVATATGLPVAAGSEAPARTGRRWMPQAAAALAATLVATLWIFGAFGRARRPLPRLVLEDVAAPYDWSMDPVAACLYIAGALDGRPFDGKAAGEEKR